MNKFNQRKFIKLIADHAYWSDEVRRLKDLGSQHASQCISPTCIELAYQDYIDDQSNGFYGNDFEEVYADLVARGEICEHCIEVRRLRKQRIAARRRLGQIRSAITMAGRKLNKTSQEDA